MSAPELHLDHCVIAISDCDVSDQFYRDVLGAEVLKLKELLAGEEREKLGDAGRVYRFGAQQLNAHSPGVEQDPRHITAKQRVAPGNSDICFCWPGPIEEAMAHLAQHGVTIEAGPRASGGAKGPGISVYFRDPDGSLLEFISYTPQVASTKGT